jgi:hypothetical protein
MIVSGLPEVFKELPMEFALGAAVLVITLRVGIDELMS